MIANFSRLPLKHPLRKLSRRLSHPIRRNHHRAPFKTHPLLPLLPSALLFPLQKTLLVRSSSHDIVIFVGDAVVHGGGLLPELYTVVPELSLHPFPDGG